MTLSQDQYTNNDDSTLITNLKNPKLVHHPNHPRKPQRYRPNPNPLLHRQSKLQPRAPHILIRVHPMGLDDVGQGGVKGRSPRHFSERFEHNRMLLERSMADWMEILELNK